LVERKFLLLLKKIRSQKKMELRNKKIKKMPKRPRKRGKNYINVHKLLNQQRIRKRMVRRKMEKIKKRMERIKQQGKRIHLKRIVEKKKIKRIRMKRKRKMKKKKKKT